MNKRVDTFRANLKNLDSVITDIYNNINDIRKYKQFAESLAKQIYKNTLQINKTRQFIAWAQRYQIHIHTLTQLHMHMRTSVKDMSELIAGRLTANILSLDHLREILDDINNKVKKIEHITCMWSLISGHIIGTHTSLQPHMIIHAYTSRYVYQ